MVVNRLQQLSRVTPHSTVQLLVFLIDRLIKKIDTINARKHQDRVRENPLGVGRDRLEVFS